MTFQLLLLLMLRDVLSLLQDAADVAVARGVILFESRSAGLFQALGRVLVRKLQESDTRLVRLLLDLVGCEALLDDLLRRRANLGSPAQEALAVPEAV